jgi:hypothetical protein
MPNDHTSQKALTEIDILLLEKFSRGQQVKCPGDALLSLGLVIVAEF